MVLNVTNEDGSLKGGDDGAQGRGFEELFVSRRVSVMGKRQCRTRADLVGVFSGK